MTHKGYILIDGVFHTYLYIAGYGYPTEMGPAWLSPLVELGDGISLSFFLDRKRKEQVLPKIAKTTMLNRTRMRDIEDTRADYEELDDAISSGLYIKDKLNREGEDFWYMHTLIEVTALDGETLNRRVQQVQNLCASMNMTVRRADWCHEQGFRSMLPVVRLDADLAKKPGGTSSPAARPLPFLSPPMNSATTRGVLLGINLHNNSGGHRGQLRYGSVQQRLVRYVRNDRCKANSSRPIVCSAPADARGAGLYRCPGKGFEYRTACEAIGGQYLRIAPGSDDCINLMEIRRTTLDIDSNMTDNVQRSDSVLLDKVQDIHTYLRLRYPEMTPEESYQLNIALLECYESLGLPKTTLPC